MQSVPYHKNHSDWVSLHLAAESYKPFIKLLTEWVLYLQKKVAFHQKYKTIWFQIFDIISFY